MEFISGFGDVDSVLNNIEILKHDYLEYYKLLCPDELQPQKVIICSTLIANDRDSLEKIILFYQSRIIILRSSNGSILKYLIEYSDINYIIDERDSNPACLIIVYKLDKRERIFYDSRLSSRASALLSDFRRYLLGDTTTEDAKKVFSDVEENKYIGAVIAKDAVLKSQIIISTLKQERQYDHAWWAFRKIVTQTHFTIVCNNEIIIFLEKHDTKSFGDIHGDLIFIPIVSIKNISLEATEKGMIMRYLFHCDKIFQLSYDSSRTDELLKVMSFINGLIAK